MAQMNPGLYQVDSTVFLAAFAWALSLGIVVWYGRSWAQLGAFRRTIYLVSWVLLVLLPLVALFTLMRMQGSLQ
jgi:hypothetical protein